MPIIPKRVEGVPVWCKGCDRAIPIGKKYYPLVSPRNGRILPICSECYEALRMADRLGILKKRSEKKRVNQREEICLGRGLEGSSS